MAKKIYLHLFQFLQCKTERRHICIMYILWHIYTMAQNPGRVLTGFKFSENLLGSKIEKPHVINSSELLDEIFEFFSDFRAQCSI